MAWFQLDRNRSRRGLAHPAIFPRPVLALC
jgi:hypothetical protein